MARNNMEVICVTTDDCPRNEEFKQLISMVPRGRMIDFYTQDMEELTVIARHRILPVPTFIVVNGNGKVVCRVVHPPSMEQMVDLFQNVLALD